jgi:hypothetical protein
VKLLNDLTKGKTKNIKRTDYESISFQYLIENVRLTESVSLFLPEIEDQLILKTDASDYALGGELLRTEKSISIR